MILIDHTRSFRLRKELPEDVSIRYCDRNFYHNLKTLNRKDLDSVLEPYLTEGQIEAILVRRDLLIQYLDEFITRYGEKRVLFKFYRIENIGAEPLP